MRVVRFGCWLGVGFLSVTMALGCRHRQAAVTYIPCDCCEVPQPIPQKVVQPVKPVSMLPAFQKDERPNVAYRVVAPGMSAGCDMVGTDEMTASDADKLSIRPGYTPGALWMPAAKHEDVPVVQKQAAEQQPVAPVSAQEEPVAPKAPATVEEAPVAPQQPAPEAQPEQKKTETEQ
jgi:hypothetical protein